MLSLLLLQEPDNSIDTLLDMIIEALNIENMSQN